MVTKVVLGMMDKKMEAICMCIYIYMYRFVFLE